MQKGLLSLKRVQQNKPERVSLKNQSAIFQRSKSHVSWNRLRLFKQNALQICVSGAIDKTGGDTIAVVFDDVASVLKKPIAGGDERLHVMKRRRKLHVPLSVLLLLTCCFSKRGNEGASFSYLEIKRGSSVQHQTMPLCCG